MICRLVEDSSEQRIKEELSLVESNRLKEERFAICDIYRDIKDFFVVFISI